VREFPQIAPEIVGRVKGQSTASDVFSPAKVGQTIFKQEELGRHPLILVQALNTNPTKRPGLNKIVCELVVDFYGNFTSLLRLCISLFLFLLTSSRAAFEPILIHHY